MSKNFELLQNLAKERDLFDTGSGTGTGTGTNTGTAVISEARPVEVNPMGGSPLQLAADEGQRDELGKLVQRFFPVIRLTNHVIPPIHAQQSRDTTPHQRVIVHQKYSRSLHGNGALTRISVPLPGLDRMVSRAGNISARSFMPISPNPVC